MLMEDGFSYTKSELQIGDDEKSELRGSSCSTGSESDELNSSVVDKNLGQAKKGMKTIENRMKYFKKHLKLLSVDQGKIVDPFRQHLAQTPGTEFKSVKMDWKESGHVSSLTTTPKPQVADKRESAMVRHKSPSRLQPVRSVSADDFQTQLDQAVQSKGNEETEKKLTQFHRIRMKKILTIDKLNEYLAMLEDKQQQRLIEEHRTTFRSFKYAGPSREGALFCLREKYRRERKAWRVKYAKKYGLLCRQVRLEKRLMRKAKRLLMRERILNALKDKTRSKLIALLEMRHEFKKLVERLKLNKEIQEKIRRQDRLSNKLEKSKSIDKPAPARRKPKVVFTSGGRNNPPVETSEVQMSGDQEFFKTSVSELNLPPLPSVPSTSSAGFDGKLPPIKQMKQGTTLLKAARSTHVKCPPLVADKKLGAGKCQSGSSSGNIPFYTSKFQNPLVKVSKAKEAPGDSRRHHLINENKYGAAQYYKLDSDFRSDSKNEFLQSLVSKEQSIQSILLMTRKSDNKENTKTSNLDKFGKSALETNERKLYEKLLKCAHGSRWKPGLLKAAQDNLVINAVSRAPIFPKMPVRILPGEMVRKSDINRVPRYKYKTEETQNLMQSFGVIYQRLLEDDLKSIFGPTNRDSFMKKVTSDVTHMAEFVFNHIDVLPLDEVADVIKTLMEFKDDPRFEFFRRLCTGFSTHYHDSKYAGMARRALKCQANVMNDELDRGYKEFELDLQQKRMGHRADKKLKGRDVKAAEETITIRKRKKKSLADKLLIARGHEFKNPVRVTTKLGGKLMLQGWKTLTYEEYINLGVPLEVERSGWRKDGMEHYEVITPRNPVDDLKYLLILNRLDLTPRRFEYPGYKYNSHIVHMFKYCSNFYRTFMMKKGDRKTDREKQKSTFQDTHSRARVFFGTGLLQGEFRVPHLRNRIFNSPPNVAQTTKPKDKNTPMAFSKRNELSDDDEDPKKLCILLQETETFDLWNFESVVALRGTAEGITYAKDARSRKKYSSRFHRCFGRETQTDLINTIDRQTQAFAPCRDSKKTNVYQTDIVKASEDPPPPVVKAIKIPGFQDDDVSDPSTACSASSIESFPDENRQILTSSEFLSKIRLTLRIMDSMIYSEKQLTFRKGLDMDPLDPKAEISYSHERLFSFIDRRIALSEFVVTSMDWSSLNPNLLAVGYARHPLYPEQDKGMICIWNVKMITKYERKFEFKNGVTYLQFCVPYPRFLNVALLDGSVLILDLGAKKNTVVTTKLSCLFSEYKPVWQFSWIEVEKDNYVPITCGDNGFIHQLRPDGTFQHSKFLSLGHREGKVKGIKISSSMGLKPRIRGRPGITCLEKHPTDPVLYLVGTTDGCVHICSIYFRNQHLDVFSAHIGAVKGIQFHPNCEHVFLTYGEDFYVRVWLYGTFQPALELMGGNFYVRAARWSPVNPEILVSISNKYVDVWDIRRKTDTPIHRFMNPRQIENTALIFDVTGRNIILGNIGGDVYVYALKNMPFTHYFKGEAIASALEKVLKAKKKFVRDIRKLGYPFGAQKDQPL